jgi:hypothetical protein
MDCAFITIACSQLAVAEVFKITPMILVKAFKAVVKVDRCLEWFIDCKRYLAINIVE